MSGRIDAFVWRVPLTGAIAAPIIEAEPPPRDSNAGGRGASSNTRAVPNPVKSEPVIPLVHAPDDPGPDGVEESEVQAGQDSDGWRKILP